MLSIFLGYCVWSMAHNLGHRLWHVHMRQGKQTDFALGESAHHQIYDNYFAFHMHNIGDPDAKFRNFPMIKVGLTLLPFVLVSFYFLTAPQAILFTTSMYFFMAIDYAVHEKIHSEKIESGLLGILQRMHVIHHKTQRHNFCFLTGIIWDVLFGSFKLG